METVAAGLYGLDLICLIAFQFLNRDYPLISHAVSDFGVGKTARLFKVYLLAGSIAAPLLGWQFWVARDPNYPVAIPVYLGLVMLGRLTLALFPNDLRDAPRTTAGHIHHAATLVAFTCAYMTVAEATPLLAATVTGPLSTALIWLKHLISLDFVLVIVTIYPPLRRFFGLTERLFLYGTAVWFLTASLALPPV